MFQKTKNNQVHMLIMEQIDDVETCLIQFESFIRALCTPQSSFDTLRNLAAGVSQQEAIADLSLRRMIDSLSGSSFLPSTREDLISIATICDRIANKCEAFSQMVVLQKYHFPEDFADSLLEIMSIIHTQFDLLEKCISQLFGHFGSFLKDHTILDLVREQESKVDAIETVLYEKTFAMDTDFAHQMQTKDFVSHICAISDLIENIADKIQIMLVTRKA